MVKMPEPDDPELTAVVAAKMICCPSGEKAAPWFPGESSLAGPGPIDLRPLAAGRDADEVAAVLDASLEDDHTVLRGKSRRAPRPWRRRG